jgi:microcystin-dependent protein
MDNPFIGAIVLFCGNFAPAGWAFCNGQLMSISQWSALFSILGTTYGGNGTTTFGLPDLRGRVPIHPGQGLGLSPYTLGETGGTEAMTLTLQNLPAHNHLLNGDNTAGGKEFPGPNHVIGASPTDKMYSVNRPNTNMSPASIGMTGNNMPFSLVQPFQCINYIIALQGIYPSRN